MSLILPYFNNSFLIVYKLLIFGITDYGNSMRKSKVMILTTLVYVLLCSSIFAQGKIDKANWLTDYNLALETAKKESKPILAYFSGSDWCRPCMQLQKKVFDSESFATFADKYFVLVHLDFPVRSENKLPDDQTEHNEEMAARFNPKGLFPAVVIVDKEEKVLGTISGYNGIETEAYITKLKSYLKID